MMNGRIKRIALAGMLFALLHSGLSARTSKPNIVLIMADDMGYECLGANGGTYNTPNLDRMAKNGIRFEHAYSQAICTPSRAKIMTGRSNMRNYVGFGKLDRRERTFANLFRDAGYRTCVAGKWQLGQEKDSPVHFGFDQALLWQQSGGRTVNGCDSRYPSPWLQHTFKEAGRIRSEYHQYPGKYGPAVISDFVIDFIRKNKEKPFLVYYPMVLTHCPFAPTQDSEDWDPTSNGSKEYKGNPRYFPDMVEYADLAVQKVLSSLDELGLAENTLVIFTGDNGTDKPIETTMKNGSVVVGSKGRTNRWGTQAMFLAQWNGVIPAGIENKTDLVDFSDILPTICDAAGITVPAKPEIDGKSFLAQLKGEKNETWPEIRCFWYSPTAKPKPQIFAQSVQYKLYDSGKFYDMQADPEQKNALETLSEEQLLLKKRMEEALIPFKALPTLRDTPDENASRPCVEIFDPAPPEGTRYEAEDGELTGEIDIRKIGGASGGARLGSMPHKGVASVAFTVDGGANGGEFDFLLGYASAIGARCRLGVNGVVQFVSLPKTGGWNTCKAVRGSVTLKPGKTNRIEIKGTKFNLDYFEVTRR